ncbi:MAG: DUF86 domain-containing protein [Xanthomonadaceae bacterium]|nr:DUF86 domain-containing protein [Rhodospirillaceae bacterium]NIA18116.1 DUF86 domain-containing protein [Xanthomonadaceae bacterium]
MISPIVFNKIISKLENLFDYYKILKEIQKVNRKSFVNDYHFYSLAERYLQLCIEIMLDISKMIINDQDLKKPEDNQNVFSVLKDEKVISKKMYNQLLGVANFRNILVHDYEKIDREIVYNNLQKNIEQFVQFRKEIAKYLNKKC